MKRVINKKVYDTETAKLIGEDSYGFPSDFRHWEEELYITKKGNYFIKGEGGALTSYAVQCGNGLGGSCVIKPVSKDQALSWCQEHEIEGNVIEENFQDMIEEA